MTGCRSPRAVPDDTDALPPDVAEHIPAYRAFDHRPYEFIWADRRPNQDQLLDFERLLGWRVETSDGVRASLVRTQERQLWNDYVGLLTYTAEGDDRWVVLHPPEPIPIRDPVDTVTCWFLGARAKGADGTAPRVLLLLESADGRAHTVELGPVDWTGWWMAHRRLSQELKAPSAYPLLFRGIRIENLPAGKDARLFMDALSLYMESLSPLRYPARPARGLPLREGQRTGLNTGEGALGFPTMTTTVIPMAGTEPERQFILRRDDGRYDLTTTNANHGITFRIDPSAGLQLVRVLKEGADTGITFPPIALSGVDAQPVPVVVRAETEHLYVEYDRGDVYRVFMRGASLIVDVSYRGREGQGVVWTGSPPSDVAQDVRFPFLQDEAYAVAPLILWRGYVESLFIHVQLDPYRSNASELFLDQRDDNEQGPWSLGARYKATTAGRRNDVHERFIITVAPRVEQVLPNIPNPPAPHAALLTNRILADTLSDTASYAEERTRAERLRRWGMDAVVFRLPDGIWRQESESASFRLRANPHRGGDTALQEFIAEQEEAGWLTALHANYRVISPLNAFWSSDVVTRSPTSDWIPAGESAYLVKPLFALEWHHRHGAERHEKFRSRAVYMDRHTAQPPWAFTDYDRRTPGAATFSQVFYADGDLMREQSRQTDGPVLVQANGAALYAGLADGLIVETKSITRRPYLPSFKLKRVQPLSVVFGAGPVTRIRTDEALDAYLADQIVYGNAGRLVRIQARPELEVRSYYAMQALQRRYLLREPRRCMYWTGDAFVNVDEALLSDALERSQVYLQYPGDTEIWVNGSATENWSVRVGARNVILPPSGWIAVAPDFRAFSGLHDGHRVDYVESAEYTYFDPRGRASSYGRLKGGGPLVVRPVEGGGIDVLDILQWGGVGLRQDYPLNWTAVEVDCLDAEGTLLGAGTFTKEGSWNLLHGPPGTMTYRLRVVPS